jgi:hypothetical protein
MIWRWIFGAFPSLITAAITAYNKSVDASVEKYRVDGTVNVAAIQAQVAIAQAQRDILVAEQGHFLTRLPRPIMGLSAASYIAKILVWDKVLAFWTHGSTEGVTGYSATLVGIVVGGYFLHDAVSKWSAK